jgi:hypothetical protein
VPAGNPDSVKVIVYVTTENVIALFTFAPFIVMLPEEGDIVYPFILPIVNEYDPFGSLNVIVSVEEELDCPFVRFTYHVVPVGNPLSVNVNV